MLLPDVLAAGAARPDEAVALVHDGEATTFAVLADRVAAAAALAAELVPPGGRLAVIGPNHPGWVELYLAVPGAGRVLTFLNHRLAPPELEAQLDRVGADVVVGELSQLERLPASARRDRTVLDWAAWARRRDASTAAAVAPPAPSSPAWLLFTSGTTGDPKGAVLTHRSVLAAVEASHGARPVPDDDVYLFPFPLCHVAGYNVVHRLSRGRPVVLLDRFDPAAFCDAVAAHGVTSTSLAATMLATLLDHVDAHPGTADRLADLRLVAYGAAPMPAALVRRARDLLGVDLTQGYGMTELSGNAVFLDAAAHRRALAGEPALLAAAGRPAPGVELRIADEDDRSLGAGEVGEILVRAPQVMSGYWDDPAATERALRGGWLHTGDVGHVTDGLLHVVDRRKDVIITGGENVASREVEEVLHHVDGVAQVAVVGVPDPVWGENVCAVVVPRPGESVDAAALVAEARRHLAGFKVPRHVVQLGALPVNASGKVQKAELRRLLVEDPDRLGPRR